MLKEHRQALQWEQQQHRARIQCSRAPREKKKKKSHGEFRISMNRKTQQRNFMALNGKSAISTNVTNNFIEQKKKELKERRQQPNRRNDLKIRSFHHQMLSRFFSIWQMWQQTGKKGNYTIIFKWATSNYISEITYRLRKCWGVEK